MPNAEKNIAVLWQDYLFLTTEMKKFLDKQDFDLFVELVSQRDRLQGMIESAQQESCKDCPPSKGLLAQINTANEDMMNKLHYVMNMENKQLNLSRAYDGYSSSLVGMRTDWKS